MLKAIIFDCFGVLATDGWLPFRDKFFKSNPELLTRAVSLNRQVDIGQITYDDFVKQIAGLANISEQLTRSSIDDNVPDNRLFDFIKDKLKSFYKIGILSNAGDNWLDKIFAPEHLALFDATVLSYQIGAIKPQAAAYQAIADKLGEKPENCLFIDDQERYCQGAIAMGMQAIHYSSFDKFVTDITPLI